MDFINLLLVAQSWPTSGVWEKILQWLTNGVGGKIAIAIIILTVCLKVMMLPLDFWQKYNTRKMTKAQALMKDELDAIKQKYKDPNDVNQKTMEVYKKHNFKPTSGCLPMIVYMAVVWLVFFTLFSSLGNISKTKINYEYSQLQQTYVVSYQQAYDEKYQQIIDENPEIPEGYDTLEDYAKASANTQAITTAQQEVAVTYDKIRQSFLSIKTIWRPDNWSSVFPTYNEFISSSSTNTKLLVVEVKDSDDNLITTYVAKTAVGDTAKDPYFNLEGKIYVEDTSLASIEINGVEYTNFVTTVELVGEQTMQQAMLAKAEENFKDDFNTVTNGINQKYEGVWNGYLGLIILTVVISFLSQFLSSIGMRTKDEKGNIVSSAKLNPVMGIMMSVLMLFFVIRYTSLFALYIVTSNILSVGLSICINLIINKLEDKKDKKKTDKITPDYVRK